MVILTARAHKQLTAPERLRLWTAVLITLLAKLRGVSADLSDGVALVDVNASVVAALGGSTLVSVVEWVDVSFIMAWTLTCVTYGQSQSRSL